MRTYTTKQGDMWDMIAYRMYPNVGRELCMTTLIEANPEYRDCAIFSGGIVLQVPDIDIPVVTNLPPWKRTTA